MSVFKLIAIAALFLYSSVSFAAFNFHQDSFTKSDFINLIDVKEARQSQESFRVLIDKSIHISNRSIIQRVKEVWYFPKSSDIQDLGQSSISFNEHTQQISLIHAATISPNGSVHLLSKEDTKQIDSNTYNVFSSWQEVLLNFPKLEAGGFTFLEYEVVTDRGEMEFDWSSIQFPQIYQKTGKYTLLVTWKGLNKPSFYKHASNINCLEKSHSIVCTAQDLPAAISDKNIYVYDQLGYVELGELQSWEEVVNISSQMFESSYSKNPKQLKNFLIKNLGETYSQTEAVHFIHQYVSRNIQYLSKSEHGHSVIPHQTEKTLDKMIGDCKDKTALFIDLAKQAGIAAYPVLVSTSRENIERSLVPSLRKFNHVVACYKINNKEYCSDLTDTETDWKDTSSWIQGKFALRILPGSTPEQIAADKYRWKYNIETQIEFLVNGGQIETQTRTYENLYSAWYKGQANGRNKEELKRWLIDDYNSVVADKVSPDMSIKGLNKMEDRVVVESSMNFAPFMDVESKLDYIEKDSWLANELKNHYPSNQFYGEYVSGLSITSKYAFTVPNAWKLTIKPADIHLSHDFGSLERKSSIDSSGRLHTETTLKLLRRYLKKEELKSYTNFLDALKAELSIRVFGDISK